jgi:hypothetical protein
MTKEEIMFTRLFIVTGMLVGFLTSQAVYADEPPVANPQATGAVGNETPPPAATKEAPKKGKKHRKHEKKAAN